MRRQCSLAAAAKIAAAVAGFGVLLMAATAFGQEGAFTLNADVRGGSATVSADGFAETVLMDNESCLITITGLDDDPSDGITWQLHMVNRLDEALHAGLAACAVNHVMCSAGINLMADPLSEADGELTWTKESLAASGITDIGTVDMILSVAGGYALDDWLDTWTKAYGKYTVTVENGADTENDDAALHLEDALYVICDDAYLGVGLMGLSEAVDENGQTQIVLQVEAENRTDTDQMFNIDNLAVNDLLSSSEGLHMGECILLANARASWRTVYTSQGVAGVGDVTKLEFDWRCGEKQMVSGSPDTGYTYGERVLRERGIKTCYPQGEENALRYQREGTDKDVLLLERDGLRVTVTDTDTTSYGEYGIAFATLFIENDTDREMTVGLESVQVNGLEGYAFLSLLLESGQRSYASVSLPFAPGTAVDEIGMMLVWGDGDLTGEDSGQQRELVTYRPVIAG